VVSSVLNISPYRCQGDGELLDKTDRAIKPRAITPPTAILCQTGEQNIVRPEKSSNGCHQLNVTCTGCAQ